MDFVVRGGGPGSSGPCMFSNAGTCAEATQLCFDFPEAGGDRLVAAPVSS